MAAPRPKNAVLSDSYWGGQFADYGTLDDAPPGALESVETLRDALAAATKDLTGVLLTGMPSSEVFMGGHWGAAVCFGAPHAPHDAPADRAPRPEQLQLRIHPRDAWTVPPRPGEVRAVAVRTLCVRTGFPHHCALLLCIGPNDDGTHLAKERSYGTAGLASTAGCGFLHVLPPSLLSRWHGLSKEVTAMGHDHSASLWSYEVVSPSAVTYLSSTGRGVVVTCGRAATFLAARIRGVHALNVLESPAPYMKEADYHTHNSALLSSVNAAIGPSDQAQATRVACRLIETLDAEALLAMRGNAFLRDALPSMVHEPGGVPLLLVVACRLCSSAAVSLENGRMISTPRDTLLNDELSSSFEEGWTPLFHAKEGGVFAIDVIIQNALVNTKAHSMENKAPDTESWL